ncbi:glycosyltransferase [Candidatus Woesearchaeota archaeon]|nr:glycosyltransferase [Candidatus Woesearchaeota archaeon]
MKYSVVIPVHNESATIVPLISEIKSVMQPLGSYEILVIDDGSTDATLPLVQSLSVKTFSFTKNYGQSAALQCGFDHAKGDIIITLDGDGQNDPRDIPRMLSALDLFDAVAGWRAQRRDGVSKVIASRLMWFMRYIVLQDPLRDAGCGLKVMKQHCLQNIEIYGELHRFILELVAMKGYRVSEVPVRHRPRRGGKTHYSNLDRAIKGNLDLFMVWFWKKYAGRPLHILGFGGFLFFVVGSLIGVYAVYLKFILDKDLSNSVFPLLSVFLLLAGIQFVTAGLLFDIVIRNYYRDKPRYELRTL